MGKKVLLILVDGMRPDSISACGSAAAKRIVQSAHWAAMDAKTVYPSVTLPCHMSLFHSVPPERHGVLTNTYTPMAREVGGLVETLHAAGKHCEFYYTWEELRDLAAPGSLDKSVFATMYSETVDDPELIVARAAIDSLRGGKADFVFLYLGVADETGHKYGWMSKEYLAAIAHAWDLIDEVLAAVPEEYQVLITADHGGHGRNHGSDDPLDMTIPIIIAGNGPKPSVRSGSAGIMDIAPTIVHWLGVLPNGAWEGTSLV